VPPPVRWAATFAAWCAHEGLRATLGDHETGTDRGRVKRAPTCSQDLRRRPSGATRSDRAVPDLDGDGIRNADLIIEAVPEKLESEAEGLWQRRAAHEADAILATNTSSIPLE